MDDAISRLGTTEEDWTKLKDEVPVILTEAGTKFDAKDMRCTICEGVRDVNPEMEKDMKINIDERVTSSTELFIRKTSADPYYQGLSTMASTHELVYSHDRNGYLVLTASLNG